LARSIAGLFLSSCGRYSSFSAFKSSSGIDAAMEPALRSLTPGPPPFVNSTPADSKAVRIFPIVSDDAAGLPAPSARLTVIVESPVIRAIVG